jgi:hypothetical protein
VDQVLVNLGVTENLLNRVKGATEKVRAELFETGTGDGSVEVYTFKERVDFDGGLYLVVVTWVSCRIPEQQRTGFAWHAHRRFADDAGHVGLR